MSSEVIDIPDKTPSKHRQGEAEQKSTSKTVEHMLSIRFIKYIFLNMFNFGVCFMAKSYIIVD